LGEEEDEGEGEEEQEDNEEDMSNLLGRTVSKVLE